METAQRLKIKIQKLKDELIKTLQDYSRSQVELWRQIPALAKEADRLKNYSSGRYQMAYLAGYWPISKNDIYGLQVELQIGEINNSQLLENIQLDKIDSILQALDARKVIALLKSEMKLLPEL